MKIGCPGTDRLVDDGEMAAILPHLREHRLRQGLEPCRTQCGANHDQRPFSTRAILVIQQQHRHAADVVTMQVRDQDEIDVFGRDPGPV